MAAILKNMSTMPIIPENCRFFVGDVVYEKAGTFGPSHQEWLQLVYLNNAEARIEDDTQTVTLHAHQACFLLPGRRYHIAFSRHERTRHGWIDARGFVPPPELRQRLEACPPVFNASQRLGQLAAMARSLRQPYDPASNRLYQDLGRAGFSEAFLQAGLQEAAGPIQPQPVVKAQTFISQHFADAVDLAAIARAAGVSRTHLIRLFKQHLQTTPIQLLWETRLSEGSRLLQQTGLSVGEIAARCGFQTPYHFSRLVRRHTGQPPRTYRQTHWGTHSS